MSECKIIEGKYRADFEESISRYLKKGYTLVNCWCRGDYLYAALIR